MRRPSLAAVLVSTAAGLVATVALRRLAARRRATAGSPAVACTPTAASVPAALAPRVAATETPRQDAVVLPFERRSPVEPAVERPAAPARCGESGGLTRSGAPCAARATAGGRCHHHRLAA
jgi:hypothetical protein